MVMPVAAVFGADRDYLASNTFCARAKHTNARLIRHSASTTIRETHSDREKKTGLQFLRF